MFPQRRPYPGSSQEIHLESKSRKSLFYTGDFNLEETRLVPEAAKFPEADTLILESTYFGEDYIPRKETEKKFIESIWNTLEIESTALLPVFAIGRIQEILMLLNTHGIRAYVDGMGRDMYKIGVCVCFRKRGIIYLLMKKRNIITPLACETLKPGRL